MDKPRQRLPLASTCIKAWDEGALICRRQPHQGHHQRSCLRTQGALALTERELHNARLVPPGCLLHPAALGQL